MRAALGSGLSVGGGHGGAIADGVLPISDRQCDRTSPGRSPAPPDSPVSENQRRVRDAAHDPLRGRARGHPRPGDDDPRGDRRRGRARAGARELLAGLGQKVDGTRVCFDREFVMAQLKLAPAQVTVQGRNPERAVTFGGGTLCMLPPGGSPFVADRERGRRDGMYADHVEIVKMTQATPLLRCGQSGATRGGRRARDEPPPRSRLLLDPLLGHALRRLRHVGPAGARQRRPRRDLARRAGGDRGRARDHRRRQPQQPARLGLPRWSTRCGPGPRPTSRSR